MIRRLAHYSHPHWSTLDQPDTGVSKQQYKTTTIHFILIFSSQHDTDNNVMKQRQQMLVIFEDLKSNQGKEGDSLTLYNNKLFHYFKLKI